MLMQPCHLPIWMATVWIPMQYTMHADSRLVMCREIVQLKVLCFTVVSQKQKTFGLHAVTLH